MSKILIAEDEDFIANLYKLNLEEHGVEVEVVPNGKIAIESLERSKPDLFLLDLLMPEVDGFQVLKHIKEQGWKLSIVILTNLSQEIDKAQCTELGAEDYLVKSDLSVEELWGNISKYL
ncbi:MAG: response regulator [Kiritimatiellales bacterium]|nr:response regulator [Kiritimatiellales bacterium]